MPLPLVQAYSTMLPQLQAEESLRFTMAIAVGNGTLKKGESRRILRAWDREAGRGQQTTRVTTAKEITAKLESVGFTRG